nr:MULTISPECIES: DJ-1/PfpI family protein [Amylolactobacillus]
MAAICGAVDFLARNGLLSHYRHTGNAQYLWQNFKEYTNHEEFIEQQAVKDRNLVTANGTAALEFTHLVLKMINFAAESEIDKTTDLYTLGFYNFSAKYGIPFTTETYY